MRDIMTEIAKVYRLEVSGSPGNYFGVIVHKPSGLRHEMEITFNTDNAALLATRAYLTGAIKRNELPLA